MKNLTVLFLILTLNSCFSQIKTNNTTIQKHYFYFDRTHPKMKVYGKKEELRHFYNLDNYDPIIFIAKDSVEKEFNITELKNYNVKDYEWLNNLKPIDLDFYFHRDRTMKEFYLIEKRESNKFLYLRKVYFIEEYD